MPAMLINKNSSNTLNNFSKLCILNLQDLYFVELLGRQQSFVCQYRVVLQGRYSDVEYCTSRLEQYVQYRTSVPSPKVLEKLAVDKKG